MPPVIGWQIDAVGLVVRGDDDAAAVKYAVFAQVLFIDAQHIGRRGGVGLHVIVELKRLLSPRSRASLTRRITDFRKPLKRPADLLRRDFMEIPGPDCVLHGLEQRVLADALSATEHQRVIDLFCGCCTRWASHFMMCRRRRSRPCDVIEPGSGFGSVAG